MEIYPHSFHIPVMGTGFTIDSALRVSRFGISSVLSLVDDVMIEQMRKVHCSKNNEPYQAIATSEPDARARRITAYLDLIQRLVQKQIQTMKTAAFSPGSDICRYFDMLPASTTKELYHKMLATVDGAEKLRLQTELRGKIIPGSIDVNIMTKLDADAYHNGTKMAPEYADAMSALRGFALSTLKSSIVFSAGINQRLYSYAGQFDDFFPDPQGGFTKKITLKVNDYRSALIQGKFLAKKGLWVSEFRIESGLNCGGHAFASECHLLGPVLEQFLQNKQCLIDTLVPIYRKALMELGRPVESIPSKIRITVQGGIGTADENAFLLKYYHIDGTGWGTPFLLVPEVTNVDPVQVEKLRTAKPEDVYLSDCSPLGVPFWNLRTSASEEARRQRIQNGHPGSTCPKGFAALNTEFTAKPVCLASRTYIARRLQHLSEQGLPTGQAALVLDKVLEKSCLCHDLAGSVSLNHSIDLQATPAICCGPNIRNFHSIASLEEMVGHIYGRISLLANHHRPHMFVEEMSLYIDHLRKEAKCFSEKISKRPQGYFDSFKKSLLEGVDYYRNITRQFIDGQRERFLEDLKTLQEEIERLRLPTPFPDTMAVSSGSSF